MDGILPFLKPPGITSHDAVAICRRILKEKRIGHSGTDVYKRQALARIKSQMRLDDKRTYADVIIDNNGTPLDLKEQLDTIWNERIESAL